MQQAKADKDCFWLHFHRRGALQAIESLSTAGLGAGGSDLEVTTDTNGAEDLFFGPLNGLA